VIKELVDEAEAAVKEAEHVSQELRRQCKADVMPVLPSPVAKAAVQGAQRTAPT